MRVMRRILSGCVVLAAMTLGNATAGFGAENLEPMAPLHFLEQDYLHRWSQNDQHEYTPEAQADLERWADMVTINHHRAASDGEALAAVANSVLENYNNHRAVVVRTDSVPRTPDRPAEYLIVVLFPQPDFIEAVFTRLKLVDSVGVVVTYSHREYGQRIGDRMSGWLQQNGPPIEAALMTLAALPMP